MPDSSGALSTSPEPPDASGSGAISHGHWFRAAVLLIALIVVGTTLPVFTVPQLEVDDFRYLQRLQWLEEDFWSNLVAASIVENRWDHLWWIDVSQKVRFFRPTVVLSYWLDAKLYGRSLLIGLLATNLVIHLACCLLAAWILFQWFGPGLPALAGSLLFAAFFCHGEVLFYVAGRTDSLAALGFLAGLALHMSGRRRALWRWLALPAYAFAFLSKELTISLPLVCLLHDWLIERRARGLRDLLRREWRLYLTYAAVAAAIQSLRALTLAGGESSLVYPYLISPLRRDFLTHLWCQLRSYGENLLLAAWTQPFTGPEEVALYNSRAGLAMTVVVLATVPLLCGRDQRFGVLAALGLATWLPTTIVYISERYLYLPSFAVAGMTSLVLDGLRARRAAYGVGLLLVLAWAAHQAYARRQQISLFASGPRSTRQIQDQVVPLHASIPRGASVLIINLPPGTWLHAQFIEDLFRVQFDDPTLTVRVLTIMPRSEGLGAGTTTVREGPNALRLIGGRSADQPQRAPLMDRQTDEFPWVNLTTGTRFSRPGLDFEVQILNGSGDRCDELRFDLPRPLEHYTILQWHPHPSAELPPVQRRQRALVEVWRP